MRTLSVLLIGMLVTTAMAADVPVTDGLSLWLKADAGVTDDGSGKVASWADQLVGDNVLADDVFQGTASDRPTLVSGKWNGLPVVEFGTAGANSYLVNAVHSSELQFGQNDPKTIFVVGKMNQTIIGYMVYFTLQHASNLPNCQIQGHGSNHTLLVGHREIDGSTPDTIVSRIPYPSKALNDIPLIAELYDTPTSGVPNARRIYDYIDGRVGDNYLGLPGFDPCQDWQGRVLQSTYIGATNGGSVNFLKGSIAEILVYRRNLTLAERHSVGIYLQTKWDVQQSSYVDPADMLNPDDPNNVPVTEGLSLWLRADVGVVVDGSNKVEQWIDQRIGDNFFPDDVFQGAATQRPTLVSSKWNGLPVVEFSRADSTFLSVTHSEELQLGQYDPKTIFIVGKKDQTESGYMTYLNMQHGSNLPALQIHGPGSPGTLLMGHRDTDGSNGDVIVSSIPNPLKYVNDIPLIAELQDIPTLGDPNVRRTYDYIDGRGGSNYLGLPGYASGQDWQGRVLEGTYLGAVNAGTTNFLEGSIAEIIVYRRALTPAERQAVGFYLQNKWDVQESDYVEPMVVAPGVPITEGLCLWLRADENVVVDENDKVVTWLDQRTGDNVCPDDVSQAVAANRPTLVSNKWNGLPVIEFSRADSTFLNKAAHSSELQFGQYDPKTIFIVGKKDQTESGYMTYLNMQHGSNLPTLQIHGPGSPGTLLMGHREISGAYGDTIISRIPNPLKYANDIPLIAELQDIPTLGDPSARRTYDYIDGRAGDNYTGMPGYVSDQDWQGRVLEGTYLGAVNAGTTNFLEGSIAEIIVYNRSLTEGERHAVGFYLEDKWGVQECDYVEPMVVAPGVPITDGLCLWLRADADVVVDGSNRVITWLDQRTGDNVYPDDASQAVAGNRPTLVNSRWNGLPAIDFSRGDSTFLGNLAHSVELQFGQNDPKSVFVVGKMDETISAYMTYLGMNHASRLPIYRSYGNGANGTILIGHRDADGSNNDTMISLVPYPAKYQNYLPLVAECQDTGEQTSQRIYPYIDGIYDNYASLPGFDAAQDWVGRAFEQTFIGSPYGDSDFLQGTIGEIIVYDRVLSASERQAVLAYLANKWLSDELADFNGDGRTDLHDFAIFALAWLSSDGQSNWNLICDIAESPDGVIDSNDLGAFLGKWLQGTN